MSDYSLTYFKQRLEFLEIDMRTLGNSPQRENERRWLLVQIKRLEQIKRSGGML